MLGDLHPPVRRSDLFDERPRAEQAPRLAALSDARGRGSWSRSDRRTALPRTPPGPRISEARPAPGCGPPVGPASARPAITTPSGSPGVRCLSSAASTRASSPSGRRGCPPSSVMSSLAPGSALTAAGVHHGSKTSIATRTPMNPGSSEFLWGPTTTLAPHCTANAWGGGAPRGPAVWAVSHAREVRRPPSCSRLELLDGDLVLGSGPGRAVGQAPAT